MYNIEHRDRIKSQISPCTNLFFNSLTRQYLQLYNCWSLKATHFISNISQKLQKNIFDVDQVSPIRNDVLLFVDIPQKLSSENWGCCTFNSMSRDAVSIKMLVSEWQTINSVSNLSQRKLYDIQQMFWLNFEISASRIRNKIRLSG